MGEQRRSVTRDGWAFADRKPTTAEVIRAFYQDIRDGAGDDAVILGCNTIGHLSAGFSRCNASATTRAARSGRARGNGCQLSGVPRAAAWHVFRGGRRLRRANVGEFGSLGEKNSQWLDLLARSGTPLFVSFPHDTVSAEQTEALRKALTAAAGPQKLAEPLDWLDSKTPSRWLLNGQEAHFTW